MHAKKLKNLGFEVPKIYDCSQVRYMLFHSVMNHITKPTYSIDRIRKYGKKYMKVKKKLVVHYFFEGANGWANWGDVLSPVMVEKLSGLTTSQKRGPADITFYGIGSIIRHALKNDNSWFNWGSGCIQKPALERLPNSSVTQILPAHQKIFSVRGPESQISLLARYGIFPLIAKDPALLIPKLIPFKNKQKLYPICIIPHFVDKTAVENALNNFSVREKNNKSESFHSLEKRIKVVHITVPTNFRKFIKAVPQNVSECEKVLSSSLHGLIVAHSYKIPAAAITLSKKVIGGNFKFRDYYESLGIFMNRDKIRHEITNKSLLANMSYLSRIVDETIQPEYPISLKSIIDTYPFPVISNYSELFDNLRLDN